MRLVESFGSPQSILSRRSGEICGAIQVSREVAAGILRCVPGPAEDREIEAVIESGCRLVTFLSDEYPPLLKMIHDPPPFLYARGRRLDDPARAGLDCAAGGQLSLPAQRIPAGRRMPWVAVVGSRKATPYGRSVARRISRDLCLAGCVVVSGMATGIDSCAHRGALDAGGPTVAVLGTGVDVAYPRENGRLLEEVCDGGVAVSEFGMGDGPEPWHFPARNRIISGMCEATLVVEAGENSGALITADLALQEGREVMAVPGPAGASMSRGTNRLIKSGAALIESAEDVLEALGVQAAENAGRAVAYAGDAVGNAVLSFLDSGPSTIDKICEGTTLPVSTIMPLLTELELRGLVERMNGAVYCRRR